MINSTDLMFGQLNKPDYPLYWGDGELGLLERDSYDNPWWSRWTIDGPSYKKATQGVYTVDGGWICFVKEVTLSNSGTKDNPDWSTVAVQSAERTGFYRPRYMPKTLSDGDVWDIASNFPWDWHDNNGNRGSGTGRWEVSGTYLDGRITIHETWFQTNAQGVTDVLEELSAFDSRGYLGFKNQRVDGKYGIVTRGCLNSV